MVGLRLKGLFSSRNGENEKMVRKGKKTAPPMSGAHQSRRMMADNVGGCEPGDGGVSGVALRREVGVAASSSVPRMTQPATSPSPPRQPSDSTVRPTPS